MTKKIKSLLVMALIYLLIPSILSFRIFMLNFLKVPYTLSYFITFIILGIIAVLFYKILKLKTSFSIKDTKLKYYLWSLAVLLFFILGDFVVGGIGPFRPSNLFVALTFPIFVAFAEELIARVVLLKTLSDAFGFKIALIAQAIFFAFFHYDFRVSAMAYFILGGVGLGLLMGPKKGNFIYPFIVHYLANVIMLLMRMY